MSSHSGKILYGLFNDDDIIVKASKTLVADGVFIRTAYSPFPIHGIEKVLGIKWTRLAICAFIYGVAGMLMALVGFWFFMIHDWPMDIGGKPSFALYLNLPAFIPVTFEFTVLCAAHGMAFTYFMRNWTFPGVKARNPHPRTTDDHFALEIHTGHNPGHDEAKLRSMLKDAGAVEVFDKESDGHH